MHNHKNTFAFILLVLIALPLQAQDDQSAQTAEFNTAYKQYQSLTQEGKRNESLPHAKQALEIGEGLFGDEHKNTAALNYNYALNLRDVGQAAESYEQMLRTIERYRAVHGDDSEELITVYMDAGGVAATARRPEEATRQYDQGLALVAANYGEDSEAYARLSLDAGSKLLDLAGSRESLPYLQKSHDVYVDTAGQDNLGTAASAFYLGKYHLNDGENGEAEKYLTEALPVFENDPQNGQRLAMLSRAFLVEVYQEQDKPEAATEHLLALGRAMPQNPEQNYLPLYQPAPEYPAAAGEDGAEGFVILEYDVDAQGFVKNIEAVEVEGHPAFEQAALEAAKDTRYVPRFVEGEPVVTEDVRVQLQFKPDSNG